MSSTKIKFLYVDRETICEKFNFRMRALKPSACEKEKSQKKIPKIENLLRNPDPRILLSSSSLSSCRRRRCPRPHPPDRHRHRRRHPPRPPITVAAIVIVVLFLLSSPLADPHGHAGRGGGGGAVAGSAPTIVAAGRILLALARLCRLAHRRSHPRSSPPPPLKPESSAKAQARHCREGVWMGESGERSKRVGEGG